MIIWGAMAVPVVTALVLLGWFRHKTVAWEFLIPFAVSIVCIGLFKWGAEKHETTDTENWGGWGAVAEYYERWDEEVPCSHVKYCTRSVTRTRSDGTTYSDTKQYDCGRLDPYDVDDHPAYWRVTDSNGETQRISSTKFEWFATRWGERRFVDLNRNYHLIDGDKYVANWDRDDVTLVPITTKHTYENRVQAASSVFNFEEVDPTVWGLYEYPSISGLDQRAVLGAVRDADKADTRLRFWNAKLGAVKQVKMFLLVFGPESTLETGLAQENYFKGGNKNEFILTLGVDATGNVTWAHVISWTEEDRLKIDVREYALDQDKLDLVDLVEYMAAEVHKNFERKEFEDFSYLMVEPPLWSVLLSYFLTILINIGLSAWIVMNRHSEYTRPSWRTY
ncbi:MAG: hypothetical protein HQ488_00410 [Parcubacteria group bacterium]|nr:hypothetical protein [Parcubacteria group bacterium]